MSTQSVPSTRRAQPRADGNVDLRDGAHDHTVKETRRAFQTTEFFAMLGVIAAIIIVGYVNDSDTLDAQRIWTLVAVVASAYMISRGLAKAGSHDSHERY